MKQSLRRLLASAALLLAAIPFSTRAAEPAAPSEAARQAGEPYLDAMREAAAAYADRDFSKALEKLDVADRIQPDIPDTYNMRGAIYAEQHAYEKATDSFEKAAKLNPRDFWAPYNLAQLLLMEKKYAAATAAFQKLAVYGGGHEELIAFKVIYGDLLLGKGADAKTVLDGMKFPSDTPAYYFAHAAWAYANKNVKEGSYWVNSGLKIFGLQRCVPFYDTLAGMGWVQAREADGSVPAQAQLSTAPLPSAEPGVTP